MIVSWLLHHHHCTLKHPDHVSPHTQLDQQHDPHHPLHSNHWYKTRWDRKRQDKTQLLVVIGPQATSHPQPSPPLPSHTPAQDQTTRPGHSSHLFAVTLNPSGKSSLSAELQGLKHKRIRYVNTLEPGAASCLRQLLSESQV